MVINNHPFELQIILGCNYCGPVTKVEMKNVQEACKDHNIFYPKEENLSRLHKADEVLGSETLAKYKASLKVKMNKRWDSKGTFFVYVLKIQH